MNNSFTGIGLNLDNEKPTTCLNAVLQEINPSSLRLSREEVLASFFNKFETLLEIFLTEGKFLIYFSLTASLRGFRYFILLCKVASTFELVQAHLLLVSLGTRRLTCPGLGSIIFVSDYKMKSLQ